MNDMIMRLPRSLEGFLSENGEGSGGFNVQENSDTSNSERAPKLIFLIVSLTFAKIQHIDLLFSRYWRLYTQLSNEPDLNPSSDRDLPLAHQFRPE